MKISSKSSIEQISMLSPTRYSVMKKVTFAAKGGIDRRSSSGLNSSKAAIRKRRTSIAVKNNSFVLKTRKSIREKNKNVNMNQLMAQFTTDEKKPVQLEAKNKGESLHEQAKCSRQHPLPNPNPRVGTKARIEFQNNLMDLGIDYHYNYVNDKVKKFRVSKKTNAIVKKMKEKEK